MNSSHCISPDSQRKLQLRMSSRNKKKPDARALFKQARGLRGDGNGGGAVSSSGAHNSSSKYKGKSKEEASH